MENDKKEGSNCQDRKQRIERHNLQVRNVPIIKETCASPDRFCTPEHKRRGSLDLGGLVDSRDLLPVHCTSSLSTLTGLSLGSRLVRPCQAVKTISTGRGASTRRNSPSLLLNHGYDWISAEDQKILTIMALRREAMLEEQDVLITARKLWEKDRILYNKIVNEKKREWIKYVQERRQTEKEELEHRKQVREDELQRHLHELEQRIQRRHQRTEQRYSNILEHKKMPRGDEEADLKLHKLRREEQEKEQHALQLLHESLVRDKELRVQNNLTTIMSRRDRSLQERRNEREKRIMAAQQTREALHQRWEEWSEENKRLLSNRLCLCQYRADKVIDWRRKVVHDNNRIKRLQHSHAMALLREEEASREQRARLELMRKEARIRQVVGNKEQAMLRSKMNALTTASLRQRIKSSCQLSDFLI